MSFTWFDKFTKACSRLDRDDQKELICALVIYGMYEEEVELPYMLDALFEGFKEDIDNSKKSHTSGSRGGRPKASEQVSETPKEGVSETPKGGVSETPKGGVSENAKPKPNQTKINQTKPNQEIEAKRKRFAPPARDEALDYAKQIGLPPGECDRFLDHFTANGWKVGGRTAMKDWKASMRNWKRNIPTFSPQSKEVVRDEYSSL